MERLTTRNIAGVAVYKHPFECERCGDTIWRLPDYGNGSPTEKLADYEDAEEQGLLLRLSCKVGDAVYIISRNNEIIPLNVHGIDIRKGDFTILAKNEKYCGYSISSLLGKYESVDWFITQAEAEKKLKEMNTDNGITE